MADHLSSSEESGPDNDNQDDDDEYLNDHTQPSWSGGKSRQVVESDNDTASENALDDVNKDKNVNSFHFPLMDSHWQ